MTGTEVDANTFELWLAVVRFYIKTIPSFFMLSIVKVILISEI